MEDVLIDQQHIGTGANQKPGGFVLKYKIKTRNLSLILRLLAATMTIIFHIINHIIYTPHVCKWGRQNIRNTF